MCCNLKPWKRKPLTEIKFKMHFISSGDLDREAFESRICYMYTYILKKQDYSAGCVLVWVVHISTYLYYRLSKIIYLVLLFSIDGSFPSAKIHRWIR